jgi:hypothetical protein
MKLRVPRPLSLFLLTVVLVLLGLGLRFGLPIYRQQVAIREIRRLGGSVRVRVNSPEWLRERLPDVWNEVFGRVIHVDLGISTVTDADLRLFRDLPDTEMVSVARSQVTDAGLHALSRLENLETLYVDPTRVTDVGLKYLEGLRRLKYVWAIRSGVGRESVERLNVAVPHLKVLWHRFREPETLDVE